MRDKNQDVTPRNIYKKLSSLARLNKRLGDKPLNLYSYGIRYTPMAQNFDQWSIFLSHDKTIDTCQSHQAQ